MIFHQPVPELPVPNVAAAMAHYCECLGFKIAWHREADGIGAVAHGDCAIFFRESTEANPATFWVYADDVDAAHSYLSSLGATITEPPEDKPWGLRQFTVTDLNGNRLIFHHD
ncbi:MAG: VOC family protein [Pseudomonadota bacterium]